MNEFVFRIDISSLRIIRYARATTSDLPIVFCRCASASTLDSSRSFSSPLSVVVVLKPEDRGWLFLGLGTRRERTTRKPTADAAAAVASRLPAFFICFAYCESPFRWWQWGRGVLYLDADMEVEEEEMPFSRRGNHGGFLEQGLMKKSIRDVCRSFETFESRSWCDVSLWK